MNKIKGFKGFDKDMKCRNFQYEVGKEYETDKAKACESGFHLCEHPLDVFAYYPPTNKNRFAEVDGSGKIDKHEKDSKVACTKIHISSEITLKYILLSSVKFIFNLVKSSTVSSATTGYSAHSATTGYSAHSATTGDYAHSATTGNSAHSATTGYSAHSATTGYYAYSATTGYYAHSATTGDSAHSATTGYSAHSATTGYSAHSATTGNSAHSATTGDSAHSATTGDSAHSATTGNSAHSATTGDSAHSATTGYYAHSATTGYSAHSEVKGKNAIACSLGKESQAKGVVDSWIVLSEYNNDGSIKTVRTARVDGSIIKEDTWYTLKNCNFVEVKL